MRSSLLNWFKAKGEVSSGAVEGLNNKIRVVTRRSYGFRTYKAMELAFISQPRQASRAGKPPTDSPDQAKVCRRLSRKK